MKAYDSLGQEVRGFQVIVARPEKKTNLRYPVVDGRRALQLMEIMAKRGRQTIAVTSSQYGEETLELSEMREIFACPQREQSSIAPTLTKEEEERAEWFDSLPKPPEPLPWLPQEKATDRHPFS